MSSAMEEVSVGQFQQRNIVTFLASEWRENLFAERLKHCHLFLAHGTKCSLVTSGDGRVVEATDVPSLKCSHSEREHQLGIQ